MSPQQLKELEQLASNARSILEDGQFETQDWENGDKSFELNNDETFIAIRESEFDKRPNARVAAKYYSAVNPDSILSLIAMNRKLVEALTDARKIITDIPNYGPEEKDEQIHGACWFCDMGDAGYSSKGRGHHDDKCLWGKAREYLRKYPRGVE